MKVLFAVSNDTISESIVKRYQKDYKEIITYKNVYYFNAILKEIQKDKTYDRIIISEELEAFTNTQLEQIDKFIFEKLDSISDEASNLRGDNIPIILIASDRRNKGEQMLLKLFGIGIYDALIGNDRSTEEVCKLMNKPRSKKDAKEYYKIESDDVKYQTENENDVSEQEIQNILAHYKKLGKNEDKYVTSFNNIVEQYNDAQLRIISKFLPLNVRAVLEEKSPKYQQIMTFNNSVTDRIRKPKNIEPDLGPSGKLLKTNNNNSMPKDPIVIPSAVNTSNVRRLTKKKAPEVTNSMANNRIMNDSIANNPVANNPVVNNPVANNPVANNPVVNNPVVNNPISNNPVANNIPNERNLNTNIENEIDKIDQINQNLEEIFANQTQEPKRRGRPRKNIEAAVETTEQVQTAPKKRGRPRKNPVVQEENILPGLDNNDAVLPGFDNIDNNDAVLPGFDNIDNNDAVLPGFDNIDNNDAVLPGFDNIDNNDAVLPGFDNIDNNDAVLPGFDNMDNNDAVLPGFDSIDNNDAGLSGFDNIDNNDAVLPRFEDIEDNDEILPGFDTIDNNKTVSPKPEETNSNNAVLPGFENIPNDDSSILGFDNILNVDSAIAGFENTGNSYNPADDFMNNMNNGYNPTNDIVNNVNENYNEANDFENVDNSYNAANDFGNVDNIFNTANNFENVNNDYGRVNNFDNNYNQYEQYNIQPTNNYVQDVDISRLLTPDKKIIAFVGTSKNGTSFILNNLAEYASSIGINVAILDTTKNKNSYYIYTKNEEELRQVAEKCLDNLIQGQARGIKANTNLSVYTSLPEDRENLNNVGQILEPLVRSHNLILIDCDFDTPYEYFSYAQEICLVQSLDILTIQPLTAFLRELKAHNVLDESKIKIILNKYVKVRGISEKTIIGGMSKYTDPSMSFMTDLFDINNAVKNSMTIQFEQEIYARYLESVIDCDVSIKGYSKTFMQKLKDLCNWVYPIASGNSSYRPPSAPAYNNTFSTSMNNTLNQMKRKY